MALPQFIKHLQSVSSRRLRAELAERVNQFYWKSVLWNESYFMAIRLVPVVAVSLSLF